MSTVRHLFFGCDQPAYRDAMGGLQKYGMSTPSLFETPIWGSKVLFGYALKIRTPKKKKGKPVFKNFFPCRHELNVKKKGFSGCVDRHVRKITQETQEAHQDGFVWACIHAINHGLSLCHPQIRHRNLQSFSNHFWIGDWFVFPESCQGPSPDVVPNVVVRKRRSCTHASNFKGKKIHNIQASIRFATT